MKYKGIKDWAGAVEQPDGAIVTARPAQQAAPPALTVFFETIRKKFKINEAAM